MELKVVEPQIKPPVVEVKIEGMTGSECLYQVDGQKLGATLTEIGYPSSVVRPLIIENSPVLAESARYDYERKSVVINQQAMINEMRQLYIYFLGRIGLHPDQSFNSDQNLWNKFISSDLFTKLMPTYWPYRMMKNWQRPAFVGNTKRREQYFKAAREGTLEPDKPPEEQRERAKKMLGRMMESSMTRSTSWTLAHEYEHRNHLGRKTAIKFGLAAGAALTTYKIFEIFNYLAISSGATKQNMEDLIISGVLTSAVTGVTAFVKGRAMEEQASYDAGDNNFRKLLGCFTLNHEVFQKKVLGI